MQHKAAVFFKCKRSYSKDLDKAMTEQELNLTTESQPLTTVRLPLRTGSCTIIFVQIVPNVGFSFPQNARTVQ